MTPAWPSEPIVVLVSGIPGAGKSTVARLLAQRLGRAAHVEGDILQGMIAAGGEWPGPLMSPEAERQLTLRLRNACALAGNFVAAGFSAVVDDVLIAFRLDDYVRLLAARPVYYVLLLPDLTTVRERNRGRPGKDVFGDWAFLDVEARALPPRGLVLDTSAQSADETAAEIHARLAREGRLA